MEGVGWLCGWLCGWVGWGGVCVLRAGVVGLFVDQGGAMVCVCFVDWCGVCV